jgi:putative transposase
MDWYSKKILSWEISNTADRFFCISCLESAIRNHGIPAYHNSDQGSQFTSPDYLKILKSNHINISMNGKGRATDNIAIERFFRTLKQDEIYLNEYKDIEDARKRIKNFIQIYNSVRPHATHGGRTPDQAYYSGLNSAVAA